MARLEVGRPGFEHGSLGGVAVLAPWYVSLKPLKEFEVIAFRAACLPLLLLRILQLLLRLRYDHSVYDYDDGRRLLLLLLLLLLALPPSRLLSLSLPCFPRADGVDEPSVHCASAIVDTKEGLGAGQRRPLYAGNDTRAACGRVHLGGAGDVGCLLNCNVQNPILESRSPTCLAGSPPSLTRSGRDQETCFDVIFVMELLNPKSWFRVMVSMNFLLTGPDNFCLAARI